MYIIQYNVIYVYKTDLRNNKKKIYVNKLGINNIFLYYFE